MSHAPDVSVPVDAADPGAPAAMRFLMTAMRWVNRACVILGMLGLLTASAVLTYSVVSRHLIGASTDWQDEVAVFCLVGATFLCSAFVQSMRGHIGIEALSTLLSARINAIRLMLVDLMSLAFCAFFSWKSWTLLHEAWSEGQTTSSSWAPPLWIPYLLMALGMTLLCLQLLLQLAAHLNAPARGRASGGGIHR